MKCSNLSASYAAMQELNPSLSFDQSTGLSQNADASDPVYFQNLSQYYVNNALARSAIAPQWEVDTSRLQDANGVGNAGLSEVERDANAGQLSVVAPAGLPAESWPALASRSTSLKPALPTPLASCSLLVSTSHCGAMALLIRT